MTTIEPPSILPIPALRHPGQKRTVTRACLAFSLLTGFAAALKAQSPQTPTGWTLIWSDGGDWPGNPDQATTFLQQILVDYVRVYKPSQTLTAALKPFP